MTIITKGILDGPLVARQEIRVMAQDQDLMNLYMLALDRFQRVDQKETLSYFQIAGIHGRPYVPFDGSKGVGSFGGYCTHSSILFPPWHRPYLALFEQALGKHVKDIANEYKDAAAKDRYQKAAQRFRLPYWDWALNADVPDFVSMQKQVTLDAPTGSVTIDNPLYQYTFRPMYSDFGDGLPDEKIWEAWRSTLRWPTTRDANGQSNAVQMERNLSNNRLTIRDRTYNLLTQARTYEAFSNDGFLGPAADPNAFDSLESIHGQMHGMTGRNGHMGVVDYAAFDPIFWLHHCNVDRVFALWQALNPTQYVVPRKNQAGTFATRAGTTEDINSPLAPFWKAEGVYWTAADARDTRTMNYTYPELVKWSTLTPGERETRIRTDINTLYGRSAPFAAIAPDLFTLRPQLTTTNTSNIATISGKPAAAPAISANNPALSQAERIRRNFEEGARRAREQMAAQAAAGGGSQQKVLAAAPPPPAGGSQQKVAAASPPPPAGAATTVASAALSVASTVAGAAGAASQKVAAVTPAPVASVATGAVGAAMAVAGAAGAAAKKVTPAPVASAASTVASKVAGTAQAVVGTSTSASLTAPAEAGKLGHAKQDSSEFTTTEAPSGLPSDKKYYNEWIANITVEKYAAKATFFVYIFLGDFNTDPAKWGEDPNLVGTHVVFANNMNFTGCENCRDAAETHKLVTGTIPLTGALGDKLGTGHVLEPAQVIPYLQKELHWRIQDAEDNVIERADLPSLKIAVAHVKVAAPTSLSEFPTWGAGEKAPEVTTGRPGGATEND